MMKNYKLFNFAIQIFCNRFIRIFFLIRFQTRLRQDDAIAICVVKIWEHAHFHRQDVRGSFWLS